MKKLIFTIMAILTIGTAVIAGCGNEAEKGSATKEKNYDIQQSLPDKQRAGDENSPDDCPNGDCNKKPEDTLPDSRFRIPRTPDDSAIHLPKDKDDCDDRPCPLPRFPRRGKHNDDTIPMPKPEPVTPD